jgi:MFS family permease
MYRDLILIAVGLFTWGIGEGMFLLFQPLYLEELGASPVAIGAILGGWGTAMAISHLPAGYLSDRIGRTPMLKAAWVLGTVSTLLMAASQTLPVFVAGLLIYGITAFVISPLNSYVTAARGRFSVARAITLISASFNLGAILGPILGGMIADRWGLGQIYPAAAVIFVVSTVFILQVRPQPVEARPTGGVQTELRINRRYVFFLGTVFLAMFAMYLPQPLSPNFLQTYHNLTFAQIGQLGSISSLGIVALNLVLGQMNVRFGFLLGQIFVGIFAILLWRGSGMPAFMLAYLLLGGYRAARALANARARELIHASQMGLAYGLVETSAAGAMILASLTAGYLYSRDPIFIYIASLVLITGSLAAGAARVIKPAAAARSSAVKDEV